jgi:ATP-dependent helicase/nuclease subunit B
VGDDVLIPDRERERAGDEVPRRAADAASSRRDFLAALASAHERVLSYARYDQRRGRELRPARALLESVDALAADGRRRSARELRDGPPPGMGEPVQFVASFADAVRDGGRSAEPVSGADWRLRSLTRWVSTGGWVSDHFLARADQVLADALAVRRARRGAQFTRFDGLVERVVIPSPNTGAVQSATGLEGFARCPRRYFFSHLLRVTARELPETVLQLTPADRGVIIHRVLERLVAEEIAGSVPDDERPDAREARMLALAEEEFADAARRGVTGHPALWALERSRMTSDLREHLRVEAEYRASTGARPVAVELDFGPASGTDVSVGTSGGTVQLRGRIDRIDELADGWIAVVDYKSGKRYSPPEDGDPLSRGERLQLPVYALAAKAAYGSERRVRAGYWFVGSPTTPDWMALDDVVQSRLADVLGTLARGIETGRFPARPGPSDMRSPRGSNCTYCAYDGMCPPDRGTSWRRKRGDPALSEYMSLVGET